MLGAATWKYKAIPRIAIFTARVRSTTGRLCFETRLSINLSVHRGGGVRSSRGGGSGPAGGEGVRSTGPARGEGQVQPAEGGGQVQLVGGA